MFARPLRGFMRFILLFLVLFFASNSFAATDRPPQYVLLAFDNCLENQSWEEVSDFLDEMNAEKDTLHYTFFTSGVSLMTDANRNDYTNPMGKKGKSNINFGGSDADLEKRLKVMDKLFRNGNEIASHAVGHYDGKNWTEDQWMHELKEFQKIIDGLAGRVSFCNHDIQGFRAPYLAGNDNMLDVLKVMNYVYDTSDTNQGWSQKMWPKRYDNGLWNFGLGFVFVPGLMGGKSLKIPAMDYNFCVHQDAGCKEKYPEALDKAEKDGQAMLAAYYDYFLTNYNGNRAPVHIGHHFQRYRGGVYNKYLQKFARQVCSMPEVKCVTYSELAKYMDGLSPGQAKDLQAGKFEKSSYQPTIEELWKSTDWKRK